MRTAIYDTVSTSLFSDDGERLYLDEQERMRYYKALSTITKPTERTFCEVFFWTGCRPREALQLDYMRVNIEGGFVIFRSVKKRGKNKGKHFRRVSIPKSFAKRLDEVHDIRNLQKQNTDNLLDRLWPFSRQKGWLLIKSVMEKAKLSGVRATARGLRHSFAVHKILSGIPITKVQEMMGHSSLAITAIYTRTVGADDRELMRRSWQREAYAAYSEK